MANRGRVSMSSILHVKIIQLVWATNLQLKEIGHLNDDDSTRFLNPIFFLLFWQIYKNPFNYGKLNNWKIDLSAVVRSALAGPAGSGQHADGPGPAAGLAGDAGEEQDGGDEGAAERPPPPLDEPAEEGGLQPAVPRSRE